MLPRQAFDSLKRHKGLYAIISTVILNAFVAIVYLIALRISLTFVVLPGGVSAVWLPSGITLALVCRFDYRVFPGIVVGSLVGLANLSWENAPVWGLTVVQVACAAGNCLQPYSAAQFLKYQGLSLQNPQTIFAQVRSAWLFALAAIVSPMVSASLGVTAGAIAQLVAWQNYGSSWVTWWVASALAHLIFTPPLLLARSSLDPKRLGEALGIFAIFSLLLWIIFYRQEPLSYILLPILMWIVFRLGALISSIAVVIVASIAIFSTSLGQGPWADYAPDVSLLLLQSFMGTFSCVCLILAAVTEERNLAQIKLKQTLANLEQEVKDRTADLAYSEAQLSGFFATAAMGMGIVDPGFRYVRINQQLAEIHQLSPEESLGKTIAEILPELSAEIEPIVQSVLDTGQPVLHHEISKGLPIHAEMENVYTSSYFPILNTENKVICVGFIFNDITHIKKLEKQLKNAALTDSLTQVANRRYFDEFLQREWQKSLELNQPITLLIFDIDYFKNYNDTYGHLQGDRCLTQVAQGIASAIDTPDALLARYGGEEFALILPNTPADLGLKQAQHIHD